MKQTLPCPRCGATDTRELEFGVNSFSCHWCEEPFIIIVDMKIADILPIEQRKIFPELQKATQNWLEKVKNEGEDSGAVAEAQCYMNRVLAAAVSVNSERTIEEQLKVLQYYAKKKVEDASGFSDD